MTPSSAAGFCPEFAFVINATRWPHDQAAIERIRQSAKMIRDPRLLLTLTRRHHVAGLVARALAHCDDMVGAVWRQELRDEAIGIAEEQFRQLIQTKTAVNALRDKGIAVAVLKGTPSALSIFGEVGVRSSIDIDLLIHRQDLERASAALSQVGYERSEPPIDANKQQLEAVSRYGKDWAFDYDHSDTGIELHWRLFQNPRLMGGVTVNDAIDMTFAGGIVLPVLRPELGTLYLVAHGAEHAWSRLKWLADLAAALRQDPNLADSLMEQAARHGIAHMTMASLLLCNELYETALPGHNFAAIGKEWRTRKLLEIARSSLIGEQDGVELEDRAMATTLKNLGHYLFSSDPRYWWREFTYDLFHDAGAAPTRRIWQRIVKVARLQSARPVS